MRKAKCIGGENEDIYAFLKAYQESKQHIMFPNVRTGYLPIQEIRILENIEYHSKIIMYCLMFLTFICVGILANLMGAL